jgi:hypothetical protein
VFEPQMSSFFHSWADAGGPNYGRFGADDMESLFAAGQQLRWAAVALGIAGALLMLQRSRWRGRLAWGLATGWVGADVVLDRMDVSGRLVAIVAAVVLCAIIAGGVVIGRRNDAEPPSYRPSATVYSGALLGSVLLTYLPVTPELAPHTPVGLVGGIQVVTVALAIAAVVTAATSTAGGPHVRMIAAGVTAASVGAAVLVDIGWQGSDRVLNPVVVFGLFGVLPLVLALLAGGVSRGRAVAVLVSTPLTGFLTLFLAVPLSVAGRPVAALTGDTAASPTPNWAVGGFLVGALLGLLATWLRRTSAVPVDRAHDAAGWLPVT